ncbi:hypothetical protein KSB_36680 [Ktedonobacter robiniae]|uniref:Uncharacterized protein n=1 Tax=Ktedonobacter robiniae TaxID=2778365 RepID=A0ABQ3UR23_9CHLR|nr:hypothetical protein KSB_36680 [Ktedonobacter robiniae]
MYLQSSLGWQDEYFQVTILAMSAIIGKKCDYVQYCSRNIDSKRELGMQLVSDVRMSHPSPMGGTSSHHL